MEMEMETRKIPVTYRIERRTPDETGFDGTRFDVMGTWRGLDGKLYTTGVLSYRGCETFREARMMKRILKGEYPFVID